MKKLLGILVLGLLYFNSAHSDEWKIKNKWKVSCGIVDKESLVVNGKPKTKYNKNEFKLESVVFKLDKGEVGKCKNDKKDGTHGGFHYAGRQEITHRLPIGHTIFETDILIEGTPQYRSTVFQIHDGRNKGAPPSWIGIGMDWKIKYKFPKGECPPNKCKKIKTVYLKPKDKKETKVKKGSDKNNSDSERDIDSGSASAPPPLRPDEDAMRSEIRSLRQTAVSLTVGEKEGASALIKEWLEDNPNKQDEGESGGE